MIKVQTSKLLKIIRYDDRQIHLRSNTHGCELIKSNMGSLYKDTKFDFREFEGNSNV